MQKKASILGIIPARGGSKGIPRKNILDIAGKPLIGWSIEEGLKSKYIDRLVLSTEDKEIAEIALKNGVEVPFLRPLELASDTASGVAPVIHMLETLPEKYDYVVLLQPTSPLRTVEDIDGCIEQCINLNANCCISMSKANTNPYLAFSISNDNHLDFIIKRDKYYTTRQQLPTAYEPNGAIYVAKCDWIRKTNKYLTEETIGYIMPKERSLDVDDYFDFELCDMLLKKRLKTTE